MFKNVKRCKINEMSQILIDLKPKRYQSELFINQKMDVTELVKFIKEKKKKDKDITYFHAFMTLFGKVIYNRPLLNRFITNRHVYERNDISLSYVMKVSLEDFEDEIMVVIKLDNNDDLYSISKKIKTRVDNIRNKSEKTSGANSAIKFFGVLPNLIRIPIISIFKWLDKHGMLPEDLSKDNIYYSSMLISNIGTLHCNGIYHNVTDFGTCSGIVTIGEIHEEGNKYYCDFGITIDERIADGFLNQFI